jgi:hypothetical protein
MRKENDKGWVGPHKKWVMGEVCWHEFDHTRVLLTLCKFLEVVRVEEIYKRQLYPTTSKLESIPTSFREGSLCMI